jgi:hypothetical protein
MGWATYLMCTIEFHKETYRTKYEVEEAIEESKRIIQICKDDLYSLCMITEPNKFCPEENDPITWIRNEFKDNIELLEGESYKLLTLELLYDNWDKCHDKDGNAIVPTDKDWWNKAYCGGDFINEVYPDETKVNE